VDALFAARLAVARRVVRAALRRIAAPATREVRVAAEPASRAAARRRAVRTERARDIAAATVLGVRRRVDAALAALGGAVRTLEDAVAVRAVRRGLVAFLAALTAVLGVGSDVRLAAVSRVSVAVEAARLARRDLAGPALALR